MTVAQARQRNAAQSMKFKARFQNAVMKLNLVAVPDVLDKIGALADQHSRRTHEFQNRTGNLESGYAHVVVPPLSSADLTWDSLDGGGSEAIANPGKDYLLVFGNPVFYAIFVELKYGLSVSINTFIMLRREVLSLGVKTLRAFKLF